VSSNAELRTDFETRRKHDRVFCTDQNVKLSIRMRGEMRSHRAELLDLSAIGAAIGLTRPLSSERTAFLTLSWKEFRIKDVVCTVSNCLQTSKTNALLTGYRCGLSFRPSSPLQLDRLETISQINDLADALAETVTQQPVKSLDVDALIADAQPLTQPTSQGLTSQGPTSKGPTSKGPTSQGPTSHLPPARATAHGNPQGLDTKQ